MTIREIYGYADRIGVLVFSTIHGEEVHSRAAHFNGFDEDGIYFRTMTSKPFYRQLLETGRVTVCGCSDTSILGHEEDGTPLFPPVYSFRLLGEIRKVSPEDIIEKAKGNEALKTAANDMVKYPAMREGNFVIHRAKVEIFDTDFEMKGRDHKVLRTRASYGGMTFNPAGPRISGECIACGACRDICSFKAIEEGQPYRVLPERCDDCGSCSTVCPVGAIEESLTF
jgi:ferredoxin